jgi:hypothetical protein
MPAVAVALEGREIGFEAAMLVIRIATPSTAEAWIVRASERTVKLLREEVDAAELTIGLGGSRDQLPPDEEALRAIAAAWLATGKALVGSSQMSGARGDPAEAAVPFAVEARAVLSQMSGWRGCGRVALRFHVSEDTRDLWRSFEECFASVRGFLPQNVSALRFLCVSFYLVWAHVIDPEVAYAHIYARDGFECRSPLCRRRDLTPHHLKFRSAGGGDEDDNVVSLCVWCHLHGVHEGRIKAQPPASDVRWELGRTPIVVVEGRRKLAAA